MCKYSLVHISEAEEEALIRGSYIMLWVHKTFMYCNCLLYICHHYANSIWLLAWRFISPALLYWSSHICFISFCLNNSQHSESQQSCRRTHGHRTEYLKSCILRSFCPSSHGYFLSKKQKKQKRKTKREKQALISPLESVRQNKVTSKAVYFMGSVSAAVCLTNTTLRWFNDSCNVIPVHNARWCWMAFDYWELFLGYIILTSGLTLCAFMWMTCMCVRVCTRACVWCWCWC